jgi:DNA-binding NarL/FixJ family response regulator
MPTPQTFPPHGADKLRIFVADDHPIVREGIKLLINAQPDMVVVGEAGDGETAWRSARELRPDIVVMDVSMPQLNGAQATERLKVACPEIKVLVLSAYSDEVHIRRLLEAGATGYVLKKTLIEELADALRVVARGGTYLDPQVAGKIVTGYVSPRRGTPDEEDLSAREREVLEMIAWGHTNKEIAARLYLSVKTVEGHKTRAMQKLELRTRADVVRYALQRNWLQDEDRAPPPVADDPR